MLKQLLHSNRRVLGIVAIVCLIGQPVQAFASTCHHVSHRICRHRYHCSKPKPRTQLVMPTGGVEAPADETPAVCRPGYKKGMVGGQEFCIPEKGPILVTDCAP